jgi:Cu2+-exporting ATPase
LPELLPPNTHTHTHRPGCRLVADAQAREAPVQRLADSVAGRFCYAIMAASASTFAFWSLAGVQLFPQALGGWRRGC